MTITMDDSRIITVAQLKEFLKASHGATLSLNDASLQERYAFITKTIKKFSYVHLVKKEKRIIYQYLRKVTGYKKAQLYRLITKAESGMLHPVPYHRIKPHRIYTTHDIKLLEKTDELHLRLSEKATKEILRREVEVFGHKDYQTIAHISHSHITNIRQSDRYRNIWINHTKSRQVSIGTTAPPENFGRPGSIRIDSVSQRDVYHINSVDEITQWEIVFCVAQLSESCMIPALKEIFAQYPFHIFNFHSDRGKETINYKVAHFLQRLLIKQTKSRSYHSNDNGLAETKNGSVIRKNLGWEHINHTLVDDMNNYLRDYFNPYLNFHRPCAYPTLTTDAKGKQKKVYTYYSTPYEVLKSIVAGDTLFKPKISFEKLDIIAYKYSDNEWATMMRNEEQKLFTKIRKMNKHGGLFS